jgi:uncharacterized protein
VREIAAVSTSVTAFVGATTLGPVNTPAHCFSFNDYGQQFGGLAAASEVSYAVRQFFEDGGSDAIVVRIAKGRRPLKKRLVEGIHALDKVYGRRRQVWDAHWRESRDRRTR